MRKNDFSAFFLSSVQRRKKPPSLSLEKIMKLPMVRRFLFFCFLVCAAVYGKTSHAIIVVMDGARYTETLGDSTQANVPKIAALAKKGLTFTNFVTATVGPSEGGKTETCPGHARITTGTYQVLANDGSVLPTMPSMFQYYLKHSGALQSRAWVIASKDKLRILANTSAEGWSGQFVPSMNCGVDGQGGHGYREDSATHAIVKKTLVSDHPVLMIVNYKGPDAMGHANKWKGYLKAIKEIDGYCADIWKTIQADPVMKNGTLLWIVNDHGRHTDDFTEHGDTCWGCRHIMSVAVGPDIKAGTIDTLTHEQIDIAPTIADLLGFSVPSAQGKAIPVLEVGDSAHGRQAPQQQ